MSSHEGDTRVRSSLPCRRGHRRDVRRGDRILVSDRSTVVAELHEPGAACSVLETGDPIIQKWIDEGVVVPAVARKGPMPVSPMRKNEGMATRLLDAHREETP